MGTFPFSDDPIILEANKSACSEGDCKCSLPRCGICNYVFVDNKYDVCEDCLNTHFCDHCMQHKTKMFVHPSGERICLDCAPKDDNHHRTNRMNVQVLDTRKILFKTRKFNDEEYERALDISRARRASKYVVHHSPEERPTPCLRETCVGCHSKFLVYLPGTERRFCNACLVFLNSNTCVKCLQELEADWVPDDFGIGPCCGGGVYKPPVGDYGITNKNNLVSVGVCINCEENYVEEGNVICEVCKTIIYKGEIA